MFDHRTRVFGDAVAVKRGLDHPTLPQMKGAFAGEQTFAKQHFRALQCPSLDEFMRVDDEHVANEIGMKDRISGLRSQTEMRDIAQRRLPRKKTGRIFSKRTEMSAYKVGFLRRRQFNGRGGFHPIELSQMRRLHRNAMRTRLIVKK